MDSKQKAIKKVVRNFWEYSSFQGRWSTEFFGDVELVEMPFQKTYTAEKIKSIAKPKNKEGVMQG